MNANSLWFSSQSGMVPLTCSFLNNFPLHGLDCTFVIQPYQELRKLLLLPWSVCEMRAMPQIAHFLNCTFSMLWNKWFIVPSIIMAAPLTKMLLELHPLSVVGAGSHLFAMSIGVLSCFSFIGLLFSACRSLALLTHWWLAILFQKTTFSQWCDCFQGKVGTSCIESL